jgi:hypothetical protein
MGCDRLLRHSLASCLLFLGLTACQEGHDLQIRPLGSGQFEFSLAALEGSDEPCIHALIIFEEKGKATPVWSAGLDDGKQCESAISTVQPPSSYSVEGKAQFEPGRSYVVQAYGPGFNLAKSFSN